MDRGGVEIDENEIFPIIKYPTAIQSNKCYIWEIQNIGMAQYNEFCSTVDFVFNSTMYNLSFSVKSK